MNKFQIHTEVCYTIDTGGVSVLNNKTKKTTFISYPEAAVWLVLNHKYTQDKSLSILGAILDDIEEDSLIYVNSCIRKWQNLDLIK